MTLWSLLSLVLFEVVTASHLLVHFFALSGKKQSTSGTFSMPYSERIALILMYVSLQDEFISLDHLMELLHVSRNTVIEDLRKVN